MEPNIFDDYFDELDDPRLDRRKRHSLIDVLFLSLCAVICGAKSFVDMADFGRAKLEWFKERLELPNGVPSHDTFGRVYSLINPEQFRDCFISWTQAMSEAVDDVIAFDGKTLRRSFDSATGMSAIHVLNAWSSANDFCVGQMKVDGKSNEITAMPQLLKLMDVKGSVITADALNCQKDIAEQIVDQGADYVLALKGNHRELFEEVKLYFETSLSDGFEEKYQFHEENDCGHGRIETRRYYAVKVEDLPWLSGTDQWKGLKSVASVESIRYNKLTNVETRECRYFISSLEVISRISRAIRCHWNVENKLHWVMDVDFGEDACRVRRDNAPQNFALARQIAHNLLKRADNDRSIRRKINLCCWDNDFLASVVGGF
jgi:predicted transposase YbfD/YdcC